MQKKEKVKTINKVIQHLYIFVLILIMVSCSRENDTVLTECIDVCNGITSHINSFQIPELINIKNPDQYLEYVKNNHSYILKNAALLRECLKNTSKLLTKDESQKWIETAVDLTHVGSRWVYYIEKPEVYNDDDINSVPKFEYRLKRDLEYLQSIGQHECNAKNT